MVSTLMNGAVVTLRARTTCLAVQFRLIVNRRVRRARLKRDTGANDPAPAPLQLGARAALPCDDASMPTLDALRRLFPRGYNSGDVLSRIPGPRRIIEEVRVGASYRDVF